MAESSSFKDSRWSLHGMTALVTGGTRGIGNATVEELAGLGARVHICSRNEEELTSGAGSIVFISSVADLVHLGAGSIYGASKGAMNQLARTLACEWAKDNIRTNCVAPWYIRTSLVEHLLDDKVFLDTVFSNPSPARSLSSAMEIQRKSRPWWDFFVYLLLLT